MSFFTNPAVQQIRRFSRIMRINRPLAKAAVTLRGGRYEARFDQAMEGALADVSVIWDIGANRGLYTSKFAEALRGRGTVCAFEPSPRSIAVLESLFRGDSTVKILPLALSYHCGTSFFGFGEDDEGTTDALTQDATGIEVEVATIDELIAQKRVPAPDMIKMDVEGFEWDVFEGMRKLLAESPPIHIFLEVHFSKLDGRGQTHAAADIEQLLKSSGYQVKWVDNSHLHAMLGR